MSNAAISTLADPRIIALLERIADSIDGIREDGRSCLELLRAQSNGHTAVKDALLTPADLANLLRIDQRTLRELRHAGGVPKAITLGRSPRWHRSAIEAWLAKGRAK